MGRRPGHATVGFAEFGNALNFGAAGELNTDVCERSHDGLWPAILVFEETHENQHERLIGLIIMTKPCTVAVGINTAIKQLEWCELLVPRNRLVNVSRGQRNVRPTRCWRVNNVLIRCIADLIL